MLWLRSAGVRMRGTGSARRAASVGPAGDGHVSPERTDGSCLLACSLARLRKDGRAPASRRLESRHLRLEIEAQVRGFILGRVLINWFMSASPRDRPKYCVAAK